MKKEKNQSRGNVNIDVWKQRREPVPVDPRQTRFDFGQSQTLEDLLSQSNTSPILLDRGSKASQVPFPQSNSLCEIDLLSELEKQQQEYEARVIEEDGEVENGPRCEFLTGAAGTGKTYNIKERIEKQYVGSNGSNIVVGVNGGSGKVGRVSDRRKYGLLCATTGIAAINLSGGEESSTVKTIHSTLGFYDVNSLERAYQNGSLHRKIRIVAKEYQNLIVDEVSMMSARHLDIIYRAVEECYEKSESFKGLGLVLTGDFCQLPPVPDKDGQSRKTIAGTEKYAFESKYWEEFAKNITKLTKVWRQSDPEFLKAINAARAGDGDTAADILMGLDDVTFAVTLDDKFDGTTIMSKNDAVDRYNANRLRDLTYQGKKSFTVRSHRWGVQRGEWKNIPEELTVCEDGYVMVLVNDRAGRFANGSTGWVSKYVEGTKLFMVALRNKHGEKGGEVEVGRIIRCNYVREMPEGQGLKQPDKPMGRKEWKDAHEGSKDWEYVLYLRDLTLHNKEGWGKPYYDYEQEAWVIGQVDYYPLRLAWATTVHKCVAPDSWIYLANLQYKEIRLVEIGDYIYSGIGTKFVKVIGKTRVFAEDGYIIKTELGFKIVCSREHRFPIKTFAGEELLLEAYNLRDGDSVRVEGTITKMKEPWSKITSIESWHGEKELIDIEVDSKDSLFWCNGIVTHNSQGLTLDKVQIDYSDGFFGQPSMSYVALSRVKSPQGLRIVGSPGLLAKRTNIVEEILPWI